MIGGHTMKVKVFHLDYNEHQEVVMKTVKDGRAAITRGCPRVVHALRMEEGTIWAFRFTFSSNQNIFCLSLFIAFSTTVVHHSLLGASVVLQYMYLCIKLWIRG